MCYVYTCIHIHFRECSAEDASEDLTPKAEETTEQAFDCVGSTEELRASRLYSARQHGRRRIANPPIPKAGGPE